MTFRKSNIKNCSFGCFFYAPMVENWMTKMLENWEITDICLNSILGYLVVNAHFICKNGVSCAILMSQNCAFMSFRRIIYESSF